MSSHKLTLWHIGDEARVISCLLINRLLLLRYVLVVSHVTQIHCYSAESPKGN